MEFIFILLQITLFFFIISIKIPFKFQLINVDKKNFNPVDYLILNISIHLNFILILSFLNINISQILICYFIFIILNLLIDIKNLKNHYKEIKNYFFSLTIVFLTLFIISIDVSNLITLGWDAQKFWFYKAINFYDNGNLESLKYLDKGDGYDYPFLGSLLWSIFWKISIINEEYFGRLFYVFLYLVSLISLVNRVKLNEKFKIIFFLILVLISYDYKFFNGEQDILIFSFLAFTSSLLIRLTEDLSTQKVNSTILQILLLCNLLIWTKAEGMVYSIIIILSIISLFKIKLNTKILLLISLLIIIITRLLIYKFYGLNIGVNSCCWNDLSPSGIINKISLERLIIISKFFVISILKNYLILFSLLFLIISRYKLNIISQNLYNYFIIFLCIGFIYIAYLLTDVDLIFMLKTGMDRLLFSITPFFIIIIIHYINFNKNYFK